MNSKAKSDRGNFATLAADESRQNNYQDESVDPQLVDENDLRRQATTKEDDTDDISPEDEAALCKEAIFVKEYNYESLAKKADLLTAYRYLYWACFRGHLHVANFILHKCRISPFMCDPRTQKSPFMKAIEGNQFLMTKLLLAKDFKVPEKP